MTVSVEECENSLKPELTKNSRRRFEWSLYYRY